MYTHIYVYTYIYIHIYIHATRGKCTSWDVCNTWHGNRDNTASKKYHRERE